MFLVLELRLKRPAAWGLTKGLLAKQCACNRIQDIMLGTTVRIIRTLATTELTNQKRDNRPVLMQTLVIMSMVMQ